jgi:hypothetical protein
MNVRVSHPQTIFIWDQLIASSGHCPVIVGDVWRWMVYKNDGRKENLSSIVTLKSVPTLSEVLHGRKFCYHVDMNLSILSSAHIV